MKNTQFIKTHGHFFVFAKTMSISLGGVSKGRYYHDIIDRKLHRLGVGLLAEENIIAQADKLEDIIDCYCYDTETTKDFGVALGWKFADQKRAIYGCIKANSGLLFVSALDCEGKLKLL